MIRFAPASTTIDEFIIHVIIIVFFYTSRNPPKKTINSDYLMKKNNRIKKPLSEVPEGTLFVKEEDSTALLGISAVVYIKQATPATPNSVARIVLCLNPHMCGRAISPEVVNLQSEICLVDMAELYGLIPLYNYQALTAYQASIGLIQTVE